MNKNDIKIFCTLGPASLNKKFLEYTNGKISLLRLNLSHLKIKELIKYIKFVKKYSNVPICIDTEGAQIRTKVKKNIFYKKNSKIKLNLYGGNFNIYPEDIFNKLKINDILDIGFSNLKVKITGKKNNSMNLNAISAGMLENNKGVHLVNRKIKINYLTKKDIEAIKIAKKFKIKNFALSFTNSKQDILKFNKILKTENKIYKIETKNAIKNIDDIISHGNKFIIDRGDLSKEVSIENIPAIQRMIINVSKKKTQKKQVFIATNLLENMINSSFISRGEANDIFSCVEIGASGLVLAGETAVGNNPIKSIEFLIKVIKTFKKFKIKY